MVAIDFTRKIVLICGSSYAGEMKKSVFTTLNFYLPARERRADALLGQCRPGRRQRAVLRPVRHRQDHAVGRSQPHADRRRRARLGPGRHLQFRGRLLRQVHQAQPRSRADDLGRHQPLRRRAGERGVRSGDARSRLRRRLQDREHPLGLSARLHPERLAHRPRRASEEHHLPHRRRLRRDAADRQALGDAGDVSLPFRLHRQGRRHREGPGRRGAGILHLLRRAVPAAASVRLCRPAARLHQPAQGRLSGWSIPAGPAANTASAAACRSRRRARC